ncbi:MAG: o-succinylbenzoate synthase [Gemmatimonadetes bacterium]|nr:o-succinylbenzoate synthase [Gemmatimonadota bacterium]MBI3504504.1 o-succinylbenzoate synthase [Pseudomonadota bacterium]
MRIDALTLRELRLPLKEPFRISSGAVHERRIFLLELRDASGASTWSECVAGEAPNYSSEFIDSAWIAIAQCVAPRVLARAFEHPGEVHEEMERDFRGHQMAKAAVEMGMWALAATIAGEPLARYIGGTRTEIATGISLGIQQSPEALIAKVKGALAEGYRKVKIKIEPGHDVPWLRAVRDAVGPEAHLMADANNAYTLDDADQLAALDELHLMMIEQPLAHDDLVRHATLQKRLRTPICLDESITSLDRAQDMVALGSGRIVNIKPGRVGGFTSAIAIHDYCQEAGVPVWCGGMLESGVGRAYNVALASLPNFTLPGDVSPSARYWARDVVTPEWTMDRGMVRVPLERAGLGVDIDVERIEALTVRTQALRA